MWLAWRVDQTRAASWASLPTKSFLRFHGQIILVPPMVEKMQCPAGHCIFSSNHFSTISRISMGQALTQMPQAMHLLATGLSSAFTSTWKGQMSLHLPQPTQSFLLIMYTPLAFWVMAPCSQTVAHLPHWPQVMALAAALCSMIRA